MALTLDLTDNATTPTGFTATVAGSSGPTVSIFYTPADRPWPMDPWILAGTRVGDGAVVVPVDPRYYFVYATIPGLCSPPERVAVTTGLDEDATRMQASICATLNLLALPSRSDYLASPRLTAADPGWTGIGVLDHFREDWMERRYPCFEVSVEGQTEGQEIGSNGTDDIVYPFRVMLYDTGISARRHDHKPWVQWCRAKLSKAFRNRHLASITSSVVVKVEPLSIFVKQPDDGSRPKDLYAGGFTIKCVNRERRGLGA
jgi:hypothetical protein